jgi:N-acetylglucosaminyldiphosphoundecaprenol N-acetyl-beta-D-mannosaminyltransferase
MIPARLTGVGSRTAGSRIYLLGDATTGDESGGGGRPLSHRKEGPPRAESNGVIVHSNILGVRFAAVRLDVLRSAVRRVLSASERKCEYLCPTGVHGVIEAQSDPDLRRTLNRAAFNVPDGMPIVVFSRLFGCTEIERAFGPDVMLSILEDSADLGVRHFFYGGREGVAVQLAETLKARFPGLIVAGSYCPPFRPLTEHEKSHVAGLINASGADVVWVGLSTPKQELWIADMRHRISVKLLCAVGAAFDYHTGSIREAPLWMKKSALEWLFRLLQEPGRLWRRYAEIVPKFLILITLQLTGLRRYPVED